MATSATKIQPRRIVLVCGTLALGLAVLCLFGWWSRNWILASFGADKIQMAPSTALGVLLLGVALVQAARTPQGLGKAVSGSSLVVVLLAGTNLAFWLVGWDSPLDAFLSGTDQTLNGVLVGRMSPVTALLFLSTGLGLYFRSRPVVAAPGALMGLGVGLVFTLGYWWGLPEVFYSRGIVPPALPTSLCLAALNGGLLFLVGPGFAPLRTILGDSGPARGFRRVMLALVIVGLATILRELLVSGLGRNIPFLTYFPAVMVAAILGGPLAGAVATVVSFPLAVLWIQNGALSPVEWVAAGIFLLSSGLIVGVARALLKANRRTGEALALADQRGTLLQHEVEALRSVTRRLELSLAAAKAGTWEWELATNTNYWSDEIWELYGLSFRQVEPSYQAWLESIHPDDRDRVAQTLAATVERSGELRLEWRVNCPEPGRWLMSRGSPEFDQGRTVRYLGVVIDISDRKRAEEEAGELQAQLLHAQTLENLGGLAGGIAHDMNNVLAAILTQATAKLMTLPADDGHLAAFERIARAAERGGKMVKSLLSFARKDRVETKVLDLNALVLEEMDLLERTTESRLTLQTHLDPDLAPIEGDPSALVQVLMNLCVNAIDAMDTGGVLTLTTRNQGDCLVQLQIRDTGTGMAPEVLARATEPFFTTKPAGKGTGLGLSLAETVVRAHHGTMEVESVPGQGTLVTLSFPAALGQECSETDTLDPGAPGAGKTILLVDDDDLVREALAETLGLMGHHVTAASRGEIALEHLARGFHPDLVVLDMNMPGIGGAATLGQLRLSHPQLPVLLATGRTDQSALDLVTAWPHVVLLPKPFGVEDIVVKLQSLP